MGQSAPGEEVEMDFGRLVWSYSVDFPEGLTPTRHPSRSRQPRLRLDPTVASVSAETWAAARSRRGRACALCSRIT